jgi:hypothetical protein
MDMDPAGIIGPEVRNFFSNENTGKQACFKLALGFFIFSISQFNMPVPGVRRQFSLNNSPFFTFFSFRLKQNGIFDPYKNK